MKEKQINMLFFTRTMKLGGTEKVILQLCETMKPDFNKIVVCSCGGINVEKLKEMNIKHYDIPDMEKKDIKTIITILSTLFKIIRDEDINVVHTHHRMAAFYARVLKVLKKFIFIHNAHNTFTDKKYLTKFALSKAHVIAVGNKVKDNLCEYYNIPKSHISVIPNGIEPFVDPIQPIEILEKYKREGYFLVGNIGRLSEQKGMEYYVKAAAKVLKELSMIKFFIIGDGEDRAKIESLIKDMNLEDDVILLGYRHDIQNVMKQLDLIVLSSLWEGLPLTPIEAFSVEKTIVATAVDGTVEIVEDGVNGALVNAKDTNAIADKVLELYKSPDRIRMYEKNASKRYNTEFSYEVLQGRYRKYYKNFME